MRELPRDLVTILRTEAKNQRTPPIDYVIAEDGGRMVHRPEPDIAMAELLEEAASALAAERAAREKAEAKLAEARKALAALDRMSRGVDWCDQDEQARRWSAARRALEGGKEYLTARLPEPASRTVTEAMVEALKRIRDTAMEHTLAARIPECGVFGGIAQDADWLMSELTAAIPSDLSGPPPSTTSTAA